VFIADKWMNQDWLQSEGIGCSPRVRAVVVVVASYWGLLQDSNTIDRHDE
jgi:hypothetical protein